MYTVREFSARAGVTVRALHHCDDVGLLKPLRRPQTGYRLYRDSDFAKLEQIVVLKFLGLPLKDMRPLLTATKTARLRDVLRRQQRMLAEKRRQLDAALAGAHRRLHPGRPAGRAGRRDNVGGPRQLAGRPGKELPPAGLRHTIRARGLDPDVVSGSMMLRSC